VKLRQMTVGLLALLLSVQSTSATQIAVMRSKEGVLVGANVWSGLEMNGQVRRGPDVCKIATSGNFAAMVLGDHLAYPVWAKDGHSFSERPGADALITSNHLAPNASMLSFGNVPTSLRKALPKKGDLNQNREVVVAAVKAALRDQMDAVDVFAPEQRWPSGPFSGMALILVGIDKGSVQAQLIRVDIDEWVSRKFKVVDVTTLPNEVGQWIVWGPHTQIPGKLNNLDPKLDDLRGIMTGIDQSINGEYKRYKEMLAPPFVIGELRADGIHWGPDLGPCAKEVSPTKRAKK
jgi:hypothetical protein